jgi:RNA polymerase sigma factor (sigma-70 family)
MEGVMESPEVLFEKHKRLVEPILRKMKVRSSSFDDARQSGLLGLWHACTHAREDAKGTFEGYAFWCIKGHILRFLRGDRLIRIPNHLQGQERAKAWEDTEISGGDSLHAGEAQAARRRMGRHRREVEVLDLAMDVKPILDMIHPRLRTVLMQRAAGRRLDDIGRELGVTRERVRQIEVKARKEFFSLSWMLTEKSA